jgi:hypothetical protein
MEHVDAEGTGRVISIESDGLDELADDLRSAAERAPEEARKVTSKGALNIKTDWRKRWSGLAHAPATPRAISYDITSAGSMIVAEIGPDKAKRQGALGNLLEFGSINNAPIPGGAPALQVESPRFVQALEDLAARLLEERL